MDAVDGRACTREGSRKASSGSIPPKASAVREVDLLVVLIWVDAGWEEDAEVDSSV